MAIETGHAAFGPQGQIGVLTKQDSTRMLRWSLLHVLNSPDDAYAYRQLVRRMRGFVSSVDKIMLADLVEAKCGPNKEWLAFAQELRGGTE
jgi:hypothetical protein